MPFYILDYEMSEEGERYVHIDSEDCYKLPPAHNRLSIGFHENCHQAIDAAKKLYGNINACYNCCKECYVNPDKSS